MGEGRDPEPSAKTLRSTGTPLTYLISKLNIILEILVLYLISLTENIYKQQDVTAFVLMLDMLFQSSPPGVRLS